MNHVNKLKAHFTEDDELMKIWPRLEVAMHKYVEAVMLDIGSDQSLPHEEIGRRVQVLSSIRHDIRDLGVAIKKPKTKERKRLNL